jgi:predicted membrane protein
MAVWASVIFILGVIILLFHLFNAPAAFSYLWAVILMAVSLMMLYRISKKEKEGEKEKLVERLQELEKQLESQKKG